MYILEVNMKLLYQKTIIILVDTLFNAIVSILLNIMFGIVVVIS